MIGPPEWVSWEDALRAHIPTIQMHDSGLVARHDQLCYVCGNSKAIYRIDIGVFNPCESCTRRGWELRAPRRWVPAWIMAMLGDRKLRRSDAEPPAGGECSDA